MVTRPPKREGPSERAATERIVVLPGEVVATSAEKRPGFGTYRDNDEIRSWALGLRGGNERFMDVIPLGGKYFPQIGDIVVGKVVDIMPTMWLVDINAPYPAPLHAEEAPWEIEYGDTGRFLTVGDLILVKVSTVDVDKRVLVSMNGPGLRKIQEGYLVEVNHSKVPRIIGRGGSMIKLLKNKTGCRIMVGQNGRIWLEGGPESILIASLAIKRIEEQAHTMGLTEELNGYLDKLAGEHLGDRKIVHSSREDIA